MALDNITRDHGGLTRAEWSAAILAPGRTPEEIDALLALIPPERELRAYEGRQPSWIDYVLDVYPELLQLPPRP